jgi:hypothetical protein
LHVTATSTVLTKSNGANDAVHHLVVAFRQTAAISGTTLGLYLQLLDGTTGQCCVVFRSDGAILLTSGTPAGAVLDTYTGAFPVTNTWYAFEIEVAVNNTTGSWAVRKNGNTVNDRATGSLDTQNSANAYANKLTVGMQAAVNSHEIDDLYWRSSAATGSFLSDIRCYTRMPASDAAVQFSRTPTGVLTQTVPTAAPSNTTTSINNVAWFTQVTAGYSGTVTGVSVQVAVVGNAVNMKCAIYADNAGVPGAVLASATAPITPVVLGTNAFAFSGVSVVQGTKYWIASVVDGTTGNYSAQSAGTQSTGATGAVAYASFPQANPVVSNPAQTTQKSWTYTATPANWQAVAEAQQDAATSYVYSSTPGHADLYGIAPIPSTPLVTHAVTTRAYAIKSDAGTRTLAAQLKSGGTTVASPTLVLTTSNWQWAWRTDVVDPETSAPWTAAAVNLVQVGPKCVA